MTMIARLVGFKEVRLVQEPVAAALAYELDSMEDVEMAIVFDFGGGTLDVAILRVDPSQKTFFVQATAGEEHLGGEV